MSNYTLEQKREFAAKMRNNPTRAEHALYGALSKVSLKHYKQHIILGYIVDAYVPKRGTKGIVIECDGNVHDNDEQKQWDRQRDKAMVEAGYKVLRVANHTMIDHPFLVINEVRQLLGLKTRSKRKKKVKKTKKFRKYKEVKHKKHEVIIKATQVFDSDIIPLNPGAKIKRVRWGSGVGVFKSSEHRSLAAA